MLVKQDHAAVLIESWKKENFPYCYTTIFTYIQ